MKKILLSVALAIAAPFAWAQVSQTTTTTTEGGGTITSFTPGNTIVLRESSGPRTYRFGKTVTYVTKSGKVLDEDTVRTRIKVGVPVHVGHLGQRLVSLIIGHYQEHVGVRTDSRSSR